MKAIGFQPLLAALVAFGFGLSSCSDDTHTRIHRDAGGETGFLWNVPDSIPLPPENPANPVTEEKFQLGRHLFYDSRLSGNGTQSCSSCHQQDKAFSDGRSVAIGSTGQIHPRNAQGLSNVAYNASLTWANPSLVTLEKQILIPLFGEDPIEHGLSSANWPAIQQALQAEPRYQALFQKAFPTDDSYYTEAQVVYALAVFVKGLISFDSAYDRHLAGDDSQFGESARRGQKLFFGEQMECFHCHGGYNFSDSTADRTMTFVEKPFHNTGLFNLDEKGLYPNRNRGIFELTGKASDMGRFRAPSLRNVAKTAPYMHDGSIKNLGDVLDVYAAGGRNQTDGPLRGDGRKNPLKDGFVTGFKLSEADKSDLISFLESLTDDSFLTNPRFSTPW
jgi:cytochrome c peroxidase